MIEVSRTLRIGSPTPDVWDELDDYGSISTWAPNVDHSCLLTDRDGAGGGVGTIRRIQAGRTTVLERISSWEPPNALAYEIEGLPPVLRVVRNCWKLVPDDDGATSVTLTSTVDAGPRPPQQLIARIVARRLAKESESMLSGLAAHLEDHSRV